jgi:hypothetical protein
VQRKESKAVPSNRVLNAEIVLGVRRRKKKTRPPFSAALETVVTLFLIVTSRRDPSGTCPVHALCVSDAKDW